MGILEIYDMKLVMFMIAAAYFLGNISPSYLLAKKKTNVDIRTVGSGNAGTTNVLRYMGKKAAVAVLIGDLLKGAVASYTGYRLGGMEIGYLCALAVVIGHVFPVFLKFHGGKGVATSIGAMMMLEPTMVLVGLLVGILLIYRFRYVSLGAMTGVVLFSVQMFCYGSKGIPLAVSVLFALFILFTHRQNIKRLMSGTERKIGEKIK